MPYPFFVVAEWSCSQFCQSTNSNEDGRSSELIHRNTVVWCAFRHFSNSHHIISWHITRTHISGTCLNCYEANLSDFLRTIHVSPNKRNKHTDTSCVPYNSEVKNAWSYTSITPYIMAWYFANHSDNFSLPHH